jgi:hypothetical protein
MAERKPEWPEAGDQIIAAIEAGIDYGVYAKLDEYDKRGLFHVSPMCCLKNHKNPWAGTLEGKNNWYGNFVNA